MNKLTREQLERRFVLLSQCTQGLNDELVKLGFGDGIDVNEENSGLLGKYMTDLYILADLNDDYSETCFKTDAEHLAILEAKENALYPEFVEATKQLKEYGCIYVNYWSTDCDGCSSANNTSFTSVKALEDWIHASSEDCEGSWGWEYTTPDNLMCEEPRGYWGM